MARLLIARSLLPLCVTALLFAVAVADLGGCAGSAAPASTQQSIADRQEAAINDPMDYKPPPPRSVDGGSAGSFDRKGVGQDLNDLVNP